MAILTPFQANLRNLNLTDTASIIDYLTAYDLTIATPKADILDERQLCGDVDTSGNLLDGNTCIQLLQKCLTSDDKKCISDFNTLAWDQQINVDTMDYYVARNLAKHLGFYKASVNDALKGIMDKKGNVISDNVITLFNAIKEKINKVEKINNNKFNVVTVAEHVPTMQKRVPRIAFMSMFGGGTTSFSSEYINLND